ncbi:putative DNA (cytosine-5)-methyltransferase CMT1 [Euphorbia lathyris]|uniref:putative DNA (cytosine-5)-methyltransferase CMT1 n=1 Tax=Euphorbia lathyris TaxID=212925 RepID=UPI003313EBCC
MARSPKRSNPDSEPDISEEDDTILAEEDDSIPAEGDGRLFSDGVKKTKKAKLDSELSFVGDPIPEAEASQRWPLRYQWKVKKGKSIYGTSGEEEPKQAKCHYEQAMIDGTLFNVGDSAYLKAEDGQPDYIARIVELFEGTDRERYFRAQWFYRAEDTEIKGHVNQTEARRVFLSEIKDDNPLDSIVSKVKIALVKPNLDLAEKEKTIPPCDLYYDMKYTLPYLTFETIKNDDFGCNSASTSTISSDSESNNQTVDNATSDKPSEVRTCEKSEMHLLDLYSGCGAMSTGLCMGAALSGVKLVTRWAVDLNPNACKSLKINHPETEVRNEAAEDFLFLLKEWEKLCRKFSLFGSEKDPEQSADSASENGEESEEEEGENEDNDKESETSGEIFEVERLLAVCYGDPNNIKQPGLYFKVRWMGYGPSEDTWEPIKGLSDCKEKLKDFVTKGFKSNILPLPGNADFICGGPPCQGISGFNRFRNAKAPLDDPKNQQMVVFMNIVEYLKPKHVLMENVVDILKFAGGLLGRYALGRLVSMNYQARLGMMAAGSYGLPQFRRRVFLWGSHPLECLPQYPLPTHDVINKGLIPKEFEEICVAYGKDDSFPLEKALTLGDAISDLPEVANDEPQDERKYGTTPKTEFQRYIRLKRDDVVGNGSASKTTPIHQMLYDHRPLKLNDDDYQRVCRIPKKKGANFRDLPGVMVGPKNRVVWDESVEREMLPSGKPLVPDYAMKFVHGRSTKPFGRLWWDEIIATVVTRAEPHNQAFIHPLQDRVLTIREIARLQGFPDCYKLFGPIKERYIQIGNAVAVPVALALGHSLGISCQGLSDGKPLTKFPYKFPQCIQNQGPSSAEMEEDDS